MALLSKEGLRAHGPTATRAARTMAAVPTDVKHAYHVCPSPWVEKKIERVKSEFRAEMTARLAERATVQDWSDAWPEDCSTGSHFLEVSGMKNGDWGIFHEGAGMVDSLWLVVSEMDDWKPRVVGNYYLAG